MSTPTASRRSQRSGRPRSASAEPSCWASASSWWRRLVVVLSSGGSSPPAGHATTTTASASASDDDLGRLGLGHQPRRHRRVGHAFARGGDRAMAARGAGLARGAHGRRREAADPRRPLACRHVARHHVLARHHERHGHGRGLAARHRPRRRRRTDRHDVVRVRWGLAHHLRNRAVPRRGRRHRQRHRAAAAAPLRPRRGHGGAHRLPRRRLRRHELRAVGAGDGGREPLHHARPRSRCPCATRRSWRSDPTSSPSAARRGAAQAARSRRRRPFRRSTPPPTRSASSAPCPRRSTAPPPSCSTATSTWPAARRVTGRR